MRNIPLMIPSINEDDISSVVNVLRSGQLIQGKEVEALEKSIAGYTGTDYAVCVSNGTATLHLSLIALGIGKGDEVIIPALSYIATANVVELVGATPVFVDVRLTNFNIDETKIEAAITPRTKAIMPVHEFGLMSNMEAIIQIAKKHSLFVIEDAACALGAKQQNKSAGSFGDLGSFSFHPRKAITSGEGGIITTNNEQLAAKLRILRNHGVDYSSGFMDFVEAGYNYRLTDFQAAMVNSQFKRFDEILAYKQKLANIYLQNITNTAVILPTISETHNHTWQTFHVIWQGDLLRDDLIKILKENGIGSNYGAQCMPSQTYFQKKYKLNSEELFPNALKAFTNGLALPLYDKMSEDDAHYVASIINSIK